jgi:predicted transcriptional regulator
MTQHITIALTEAQEAHLRATADREEVPLEAVVSDIIQRQLEYDAWFAKAVQKGIEEADRGELIPHEEVVAESARRRAEFLARKATE